MVELKLTQEELKFCFAAIEIETALGIKNGLDALKKDHTTVVATLGISNFSDLEKATNVQNAVLILDKYGVGAQSQKIIDKAILKLQEAGKTVLTIKPIVLSQLYVRQLKTRLSSSGH